MGDARHASLLRKVHSVSPDFASTAAKSFRPQNFLVAAIHTRASMLFYCHAVYGRTARDMARQMIPAGRDPARAALEDMAVEAYRAHRITEHQLATLLGMDRYELDGFLKQREVWLEYPMDDLRQQLEVGERLWKKRQEELAASGQ
jgi:predicted HTH domain antitoxin